MLTQTYDNSIMQTLENSLNLSSVEVGNSILVIGSGALSEEFVKLVADSAKLECNMISPVEFVAISGNLGSFIVESKSKIFKISQVILFSNLPLARKKGIHFVSDYSSADDLLNAVNCLVGTYFFKENLNFNAKHCQMQDRRFNSDGSVVCSLCVEVCPNDCFEILDSKLGVNHIDCIACGKCVSVCPTASLQKNSENLESFSLKAREFKNFNPIIAESSQIKELQNLHLSHAKPFILESPNMLNVLYLLSLVQESGAQVGVLAKLDSANLAFIDEINALSKAIFGIECVVVLDSAKLASHVKQSETSIQNTINTLLFIPNAHYLYMPNAGQSAKEVLSDRLLAWVKNGNFGKFKLSNSGDVRIDKDKCTLCMSCVEACNTKALINNSASFELLYKHSLCVDCGYCKSSCPENAISVESSVFYAKFDSFSYKSVAKDEPFKCVECGKIFATKKSIDKISKLLAPAFANDALKQKSIFCCADCKIKIMFENT